MSWPQLIQLHDSQYSHAYDGSEVRETWYVEPYDALTAFVASMLGRVDSDGHNPPGPKRTLPAAHFLYPWCLATACEVVPFDPRSFSYMGGTQYPGQNATQQAAGNDVTQGMLNVSNAVSGYKGKNGFSKAAQLNPTQYVNTRFVSQDNSMYSAGAFVNVTYLPVLFPRAQSEGQETVQASDMDTIRWRFEAQERQNVINAGLKLITPPSFVNLFGAWNMFYPAAGIAPVFKEEYQDFICERRMLLPTFDLTKIAQYKNCVGNTGVQLPGLSYEFAKGTFRFDKFDTEFVQVPTVDNNGEPNGYNRWLNLVLRYAWRTTVSRVVHDSLGNVGGDPEPVTWNHVLAYPGTLSWLNGVVAGTPSGLGWYKAEYSANNAGVDSDPYPECDGPFGVVNGATDILDPINKNF